MGRTQIPEYPGDRPGSAGGEGFLAWLRRLEAKFWALEEKSPILWRLLGGTFHLLGPFPEREDRDPEKQYERVLPRSSRR